MNSKALSNLAESEPAGLMIGSILCIWSFRGSQDTISSLESILSTLPVIVLISPLWTINLLGCAFCQLGLVLVEKRECTVAIADLKSLCCRSSKNERSSVTKNIPLYTIVLLERDTT